MNRPAKDMHGVVLQPHDKFLYDGREGKVLSIWTDDTGANLTVRIEGSNHNRINSALVEKKGRHA